MNMLRQNKYEINCFSYGVLNYWKSFYNLLWRDMTLTYMPKMDFCMILRFYIKSDVND